VFDSVQVDGPLRAAGYRSAFLAMLEGDAALNCCAGCTAERGRGDDGEPAQEVGHRFRASDQVLQLNEQLVFRGNGHAQI
jgi:hypothetical protein